MLPMNLSRRVVNPVQLARASGLAHFGACQCSSQGYSYRVNYRPITGAGSLAGFAGLGLNMGAIGSVTDIFNAGATGSVLDAVQMGMNFVPGVGTMASSAMSIIRTAMSAFEGWLGIGKGRAEADIIVPVQNQLINSSGSGRIDQIVASFLSGQKPTLQQLVDWYIEVWQLGLGFMEFVLDPEFTDRRASGQALNTIMPYIDGTCGYAVPLGFEAYPGQRNCIQWGQGTLGGNGSDGVLGALARAIVSYGGTVPAIGEIYEAAGSGAPGGTGGPYSASSGALPLTMGPSGKMDFTTLGLIGVGIFALSRMKKG